MNQPALFDGVTPMLPDGFDVAWADLDARYGCRIGFEPVSVTAVGVHWTIVLKLQQRRTIAAVARPLRDAVAFLHELAREHAYLDDRFAERMGDARA